MFSKLTVLTGDCLESLKKIDDKTINCCVTSPPYYGLRDYSIDGQIGLETDPYEYINKLVAIFKEVKRVLRDDGVLWINIGDTYAGSGKGIWNNKEAQKECYIPDPQGAQSKIPKTWPQHGIKAKDLIGIPWMLAFALRADGWYLRQDIIWNKPNAMPSSVRDRCTTSHEYLFLLSKSKNYYFNNEILLEPSVKQIQPNANVSRTRDKCRIKNGICLRNRRSVWSINTRPYKDAHFAVFPPELVEPCILSGSPDDGVILDPFGGSGTTAGVAIANNRIAILCELNPKYVQLVHKRIDSIMKARTSAGVL
ncbi:DNA-methyltransferase [Gilliamella sp. BG6]|uniref:DNA-methyltransferase n=1 Tax=unclassified Gilliamella TaxID=2685620 RepID=UPI0039885369